MSVRTIVALLFAVSLVGHCAEQAPSREVDVFALDQSHAPIASVRVQLKAGELVIASATTGIDGKASLAGLQPGHYRLLATGQGLEPLERELDLTSGAAIEITLAPTLARRESVNVSGKAAPVEQGARHASATR